MLRETPSWLLRGSRALSVECFLCLMPGTPQISGGVGMVLSARRAVQIKSWHNTPFVQQRFKWWDRHQYYRLRKTLGKGSWWRYRERYVSPLRMETRKTLWYNYKPSQSECLDSQRWRWEIFQALARATTWNQALDVWMHYRHKRKSQKHFIACLHRLVALRGVNVTDWRYKTFARRLNVFRRRLLNLPRVILYFARLGDQRNVEHWSRKCHELYHLYSPRSQGMILDALARVKLQDPFIFSRASQDILRDIMSPQVSVYLLLKLLRTHSQVILRNLPLFSAISAELQRRIQLTASLVLHYDAIKELKRKSKQTLDTSAQHEPTSPKRLVPPHDYLPSIEHLSFAAFWFAELQYVDIIYFQACALQLHALLSKKSPLPPPVITRFFASFVKLDIKDFNLFYAFLRHFSTYIHDYPPTDVSHMAYLFAYVMPLSVLSVQQQLITATMHAFSCIELLHFTAVSRLIATYLSLKNVGATLCCAKRFLSVAETRMLTLLEDQKTKKLEDPLLDTPRVFQTLLDLDSTHHMLFRQLATFALRQLRYMEPKDAIALLRVIKKTNSHLGKTWLIDHSFMETFLHFVGQTLLKEMTKVEKTKLFMVLRGFENVPSILSSRCSLSQSKTVST